MAGQGNKIVATDYNAIQAKINLVLGTGTGDYGYGQSVASSQVSLANKIEATQWNAVRTDLLKARQHQTGLNESGNLALPTTSTTIKEADRAAYSNFADTITTNRLVTPPAGQATLSTLSTTTRTSPWNTTVTQTVSLAFADTSSTRAFFNAGSNLKFSASFTNYTSDGSLLVNQSWATLLANMGIITFNAYSTTNTGSGTAQSIGYYNLTTSDQLIFTKFVEASNPSYYPNQYDLYARLGTGGAQVIFTPTFSYTGGPAGPGTGQVAESANGTLTSLVQTYYATGVNVAVSPPVVSAGALVTSVVTVYTIGAGTTSINEGSSLTFNVSGSNIPNGTHYWTVTNAGDFGTSSGSFTITNNAGSFSVIPTSDATLEGAETFTASVRTGSTSGTVVATSSSITINDFILPTYSVIPAAASVDEGSSLIFNATTSNIVNGTTLYWTLDQVINESVYTSPGTYSWTAPTGVTSISIVAIGGGGAGGSRPLSGGAAGGAGGAGGGALAYINNYSVTPGQNYTVVVGRGGSSYSTYQQYLDGVGQGSPTYFAYLGSDVIRATEGIQGREYNSQNTSPYPLPIGGTWSGISGTVGYNGGQGGSQSSAGGAGGGGAGSYLNAGGTGLTYSGSGAVPTPGGAGSTATAGAQGGAAGWVAPVADPILGGAGGGGTGLFGSINYSTSSAGGSTSSATGGSGGVYGGGGGGHGVTRDEGGGAMAGIGGPGASGAVRIIWPGNIKSFPSTNVASAAGSDFGTSSGSFTITSNTGSFTVIPTTDALLEGIETFTASLRTGSTSGTVVATSGSVTINDTSTPIVPPVYSVTPASASVNEGSSLTFDVSGSNITNGTYYWTITNAGDFGTSSGSFTIVNNVGAFSVTPTADSSTEGAETFTASVRTGSTSGTVVTTSSSVTINDTSTTPVVLPSLNITYNSGSNWILSGTPIQTKADYIQVYRDASGPSTQNWSISAPGLTSQSGGTSGDIGTSSGFGSGLVYYAGPHGATTATITVSSPGYNTYYAFVPVAANSNYSPYTYANGFSQEFGRTGAALTLAQNIGNNIYNSNTQYTVNYGQGNLTRWGFYRAPEAGGVEYWTSVAIANGWDWNTQAFLNAIFQQGELNGERVTTSSKSYTSPTGYNTFNDRP